jgi:hypothetical protein
LALTVELDEFADWATAEETARTTHESRKILK